MISLALLPPFALSALAVLAPAEPLDAEAQEHFDRGLAGYTDKDYGPAIKHLRLAYALDPQPVILFAWAQAERLYGRCSRASKLYTRFLRTRPTRQQTEAARQGLERCEGQADTTDVDPDDPPREVESETAAPAPVVEEAPPPPPPPPRRKVDGAAIGLTGAGVLLGAVGAGLLGAGQNQARAAGDAPDYGAYADDAAQVRTLRITGGVLAGVGGALLVAGVVKLIVHARETRRDVAFWANPVGAGLSVRMRF